MLWIVSALTAASAGIPASPSVEPTRQARAVVRIHRATLVNVASGRVVQGDIPAERRETELQLPGEPRQRARLLEFQ